MHEEDTFFQCQVDHIISLKHNGSTSADNLAYACVFCNRNKGSDIGTVLLPDREVIRFFNPRMDQWSEHFKLEGVIITALTDIGKATAQILGFNSEDRVLERQALVSMGKYPSSGALERMTRKT